MAKRRNPQKRSARGKGAKPGRCFTRGSATKRALLCWELGDGMGHVSELLEVADGLRSRGWEIVYTGRNLRSLHDRVSQVADRILPSPFLHSMIPEHKFSARSFADVLALYGFSRIDVLKPILSAWDGLLDLVQPTVIIGDFAPFLNLAALGRTPAISTGASFYNVPWHLREFPQLSEAPGLGATEDSMMDIVSSVQRRRQRPVPSSLGEAIAGDVQVVTVLPEFDLFGKFRNPPAAGPIKPQTDPLVPRTDDRNLFLYLGFDFPATRKLIEAISVTQLRVTGYVRDCPAGLRAKLQEKGISFSAEPRRMTEALAEAWGIVHHGGVGTLTQAAFAGRPQLLLPRHMEGNFSSHLAEDLGIAKRINPGAEVEEMRESIRSFIGTESLGAAAYRFSQDLERRKPFNGLETILNLADHFASENR